jgi:hypothetical protein
MKLTIIPHTGTVNIDGVSYSDIDLSFMDSSIHAVQWKNTEGEIERWNPNNEKILANEEITDIAQFQQAIDLWNQKDAEVKAMQQELLNRPLA